MLKHVNYQKTLYVTSIELYCKITAFIPYHQVFPKKIHKFNIFDDNWLIMNSKS